ISFGRKMKADEAEVAPEPVAEEPAAEEETATGTRAVTFGRRVAESTEPVAEEPVAKEPAPVVELPVASAESSAEPAADDSGHAEGTVPEAGPVWTKEVSFSRAPERVAEAPAPEPEIVEVPAPASGVHAPVTAEELPPLPEEDAKKVPFWK